MRETVRPRQLGSGLLTRKASANDQQRLADEYRSRPVGRVGRQVVSAALADRYARAIFELGVESDQLEPLTEQIRRIAEVYAGSPELRAVLENPLVEESKRDAVLEDIASRLGSESSRPTHPVLAARRRLRVLPEIARRLGTLERRESGHCPRHRHQRRAAAGSVLPGALRGARARDAEEIVLERREIRR